MSQVPISALPTLATPLNPALQFEVAQGTSASFKVTLAQILTDPIITGSPTITDFTLATHDHSVNSQGGQLTNTALQSGEFASITGLGTQSIDLNMGIKDILQSGFLELREINLPANPAETAGRLYTRDISGTTTLFFLNSLGQEIDLLDIGVGTFLPLAGGTMTGTAIITFTNTGAGANPTISVVPSSAQTLTISDNLLIPEIIFIGNAGWQIASDANTDFFITSPTGDGSHNLDIVSESGEISLQNTTLGNDFTAKFFVEQFNALATSTAIALTIEAQIVDGTDTGDNPVIAINARQAAADIDTRPILGILNNGNNIWEISKEGNVTQAGGLDVGTNAITLEDWKIQHGGTGISELDFSTINDDSGKIVFSNTNMEYILQLDTIDVTLSINQISTQFSNKTPFETNVTIGNNNDVQGEALGVINFSTLETPFTIQQRPLFEIQNNTNASWTLDNDGTVKQTGDLNMGTNNIANGFVTSTVAGVSGITGLGDQEQDLVMGTNAITFQDWKIQHDTTFTNELKFSTIDNTPGVIRYSTTNVFYDVSLASTGIDITADQTANFSTDRVLQMNIVLLTGNDVATTDPALAIFNFSKSAGGAVVRKPLLEFQNFSVTKWKLDPDGNVTQQGDLTLGDNSVIFSDDSHFIHEHTNNLEIHTGSGNQIRMIIGDTPVSGFTYQFDTTNANWDNHGIVSMGAISFGTPSTPNTNTSIQRKTANSNSLEIDADTGGEVILRVGDSEKLSVGDTDTNFNGNNLTNAATITAKLLELTVFNGIPIILTDHSQDTPAANIPIFELAIQGENIAGDPKVYVQMVANQNNITAGSETGSLDFDILINDDDPLFMRLDGVNTTLLLGPDIDLSFTDVAETGSLILATDSNDKLTFEGARVKTGTTRVDVLAGQQTPVTNTEVDIAGLAFDVADQADGLGLVTLTLVVTPGHNNQQATFRVFLDGNFIFGKVVRIGNNGDDNNIITLVNSSLLTGKELTATAQAESGQTFDVEAASELSIFQVF